MSIRAVYSPRGKAVSLEVRDDTSDLSIVYSTFAATPEGPAEDEYHLARYFLTGTAIDIGAHAGFVTMALLADNPDLHVIAVEPLDQNLALMCANAERNGWSDRLTPLLGAVGKGKTLRIGWDFRGDVGDFRRTNRFIGGLQQQLDYSDSWADVPAYTLGALVKMAGGSVDLIKWDCEGCEWPGLKDPAVAKVRVVVGEWHGDPAIPGLTERLGATHDFDWNTEGAAGRFYAVRRTA